MTPVTPVPFYPVIYTVVVEAYIGGYYSEAKAKAGYQYQYGRRGTTMASVCWNR